MVEKQNSEAKVEVFISTHKDKHIIKNLFVFFRYELMPFILVGAGSSINEHGTIDIDDKGSMTHDEAIRDCDIFWEKPNIVFPMLIKANNKPAGFIIVTTPPYTHLNFNYRVDDFFILNKYRRKGIGRKAVNTVFDRFRGKWEVEYLPQNKVAGIFWQKVIQEYTNGKYSENIFCVSSENELPGYYFDNSYKQI